MEESLALRSVTFVVLVSSIKGGALKRTLPVGNLITLKWVLPWMSMAAHPVGEDDMSAWLC